MRDMQNQNLYVYQEVAKSKNLGLWQSKNPSPWVWRRKNELKYLMRAFIAKLLFKLPKSI